MNLKALFWLPIMAAFTLGFLRTLLGALENMQLDAESLTILCIVALAFGSIIKALLWAISNLFSENEE